MYSEIDRRASAQRANDEFLRRMLGGELCGGAREAMNQGVMEESARPTLPPVNNGTACDGSERGHGGCGRAESDGHEGGCGRGGCNGGGNGDGTDRGCPKHVHAPALAMVYAPRQCWQNVLDPMSGLAHGSIFAELVLPFEGDRGCGEKEVRTRK